jgi:FAD/FMN-containing dehydrogenase
VHALTRLQCTKLSHLLYNGTAFPNSAAYTSSLDSYYNLQEQEVIPACIVSPTSADQVSLIVKTVVDAGAKFAVRGGGHTLNPGAANIEGGVTISLRSMNSVHVNSDKTIASVGGGAKWGEVYPTLDALGISILGGRLSDVGVGGLTTGGITPQKDPTPHHS